MSFSERDRNAAIIAQYTFPHATGIVPDKNPLMLRVVDDGSITRLKKAKSMWSMLQNAAHALHLWKVKDSACHHALQNSRLLREHLLMCLQQRKVLVHVLDLNTGFYVYRPVQDKEVRELTFCLQHEQHYSLIFLKGDDPSVMSLTYLGAYEAS